MRGAPPYKLDLKTIDEVGKMNLFEIRDCMGKRLEAYDKCESCPEIVFCSKMTLKNWFPKINIIGP